jgi:hypothetical protein
MELVAGGGWRPLEIEAVSEPGEGTSPSPVERLSFSDDGLEPVGQQGTDRSPFLGCNDARLAQKIDIELQRDVRLHEGAS